MTSTKENNLVWIDLEMTGLNPKEDTILEISMIITNSNLEIIGEDNTYYIQHNQKDFDNMNQWCQEHHTKSGLWDKVVESTLSIEEAESSILKFLEAFTEKGKNILCGNSIHQDRRFIHKYMPRLDELLHYRMIDVSTLKELCGRWYQDSNAEFTKKNSHRAYDDIVESIEELKFYRKNFFK